MKKLAYAGWPNCCRLSNDRVELIVTTDVGPRVIRFGFVGGDNEFVELAGQVGRTGGDDWRVYGGHRLWHAPEAQPRTYFPDNGPVKFEPLGDAVRLTQPAEPTTGIVKQIDIRLDERDGAARLTHRLINTGCWPVELAAWAITAMAPGGVGILPLPPRGSHQQQLTPTGTLALWAYTDLTDPRWTVGRQYVLLRHDASRPQSQKIGGPAPDGWVAHVRAGRLFIKTFHHSPHGAYPDLGCSAELFANGDLLELETLGPLTRLAPGGCVEHVERWLLLDGFQTPACDDEVTADIVPRLPRSAG